MCSSCLCSQRYEIWRRNVAARANSLACCPKSWTSFDCRPRRWTWPALASLTTPASLFWPMGWAWLLNEVSLATMTCAHTQRYNEHSQLVLALLIIHSLYNIWCLEGYLTTGEKNCFGSFKISAKCLPAYNCILENVSGKLMGYINLQIHTAVSTAMFLWSNWLSEPRSKMKHSALFRLVSW